MTVAGRTILIKNPVRLGVFDRFGKKGTAFDLALSYIAWRIDLSFSRPQAACCNRNAEGHAVCLAKDGIELFRVISELFLVALCKEIKHVLRFHVNKER